MIEGTVTFIGDVHGWADRLGDLLDQAEGLPVLMGDLIDRGPDSPRVLDRVQALVAGGRAACLLGNHEFALVRGLGIPEAGIRAVPGLFDAWYHGYGGRAVCAAYGIERADPHRLRSRLGPHLAWMASLPWVLEGSSGARRWIAVHAGLGSDPWRGQVESLRDPVEWWRESEDVHPPALYSKARTTVVPGDLPPECCVVSGHTPVETARVEARRILCDTTGGLRDRRLTGVVWPSGRILRSR